MRSFGIFSRAAALSTGVALLSLAPPAAAEAARFPNCNVWATVQCNKAYDDWSLYYETWEDCIAFEIQFCPYPDRSADNSGLVNLASRSSLVPKLALSAGQVTTAA